MKGECGCSGSSSCMSFLSSSIILSLGAGPLFVPLHPSHFQYQKSLKTLIREDEDILIPHE
ncbi:hypothetical protein DL95DRAFT_379046 [Leptodontidium sp. 2 PMI_412]|nr:hypothetical protein DL95DRAFT_379046 [Leptodontidium sp. 2 PMI_412]